MHALSGGPIAGTLSRTQRVEDETNQGQLFSARIRKSLKDFRILITGGAQALSEKR